MEAKRKSEKVRRTREGKITKIDSKTERKKMDLRQTEQVMKNSESRVRENQHLNHPRQTDSGTALQLYLDRIPITSIPGIKHAPVLELKDVDSVRDGIHFLYSKNVCGALIADTATGRFVDRYIGFIDLADMLLWCLEEYEKGSESGDIEHNLDVFAILEKCPNIGQTKIAELAKAFLWHPFFPVYLDDALFHVLLLLSKHRLQVVPVVERSDSHVIGYMTPNAVMQLLLQSSGLEWFDSIADKPLSEFRFENEEQALQVNGDQSIAEALRVLQKSRIGAVAVTNRESKKLIGSVRNCDVYLVSEKETLLHNKKITVEEFIQMNNDKRGSDPTAEQGLDSILRLRNNLLPGMNSPVTNKKTDTLKQVMEKMVRTRSDFSFLVDESKQVRGVITFRDIMVQFAPPCIDSSIHGGGFFEAALEQTGCQVKDGTVICNK